MKETKYIKPKKTILNPIRVMKSKKRLPLIVLLAAVFILAGMIYMLFRPYTEATKLTRNVKVKAAG